MTSDERVITLLRAGLNAEVIAAILDTDLGDVQNVVGDPAHHDVPAAGGGGFTQAPNGAFGDPTVAPAFLGWFDDHNTVAAMDTTGMKAGTWAHAFNVALTEPVLMMLDQDSGTFMVISVTG